MDLAIGGALAKAALVVIVALGLTWIVRSRLLGVLRLAPGVRTPVRYRWALLPSRAARLHRRLQVVANACVDALGGAREPRRRRRRGEATAAGPVGEARARVRDTLDRAVALDTRLARTARAPDGATARRKGIQELRHEIAELEVAAQRALGTHRQARAEVGPVAPDVVLDDRAAATIVEESTPDDR